MYFHCMRKVLSGLLLVILAFNWLGYDLVVALLNENIKYTTQVKIDKKEFDPQQLIEIKVDLELPYSTDWSSFEKASGTVTFQGVVYNFIEKKYKSGQMVYRCLPNKRVTELQNARDYFYSLAYDMEKDQQKESAPSQISSKKLSIESTFKELLAHAHINSDYSFFHNPPLVKSIRDGFGFIPTQPPEA